MIKNLNMGVTSPTKKNDNLACFLKRKRIELGLKLEDLSQGICSTSYLSRIENNQLEVKEEYYLALFEKLNIDYEKVVKERSKNIFQELIVSYLKYDYETIETIVMHALSSNSYVDIEIELMVLFYNIINKMYEEARNIMLKLQSISNTFINQELLFYMFCFSLYLYQTNQTIRAYQEINILLNIKIDDDLMALAIYDLAMDIYMIVGQYSLVYECYHHIEKLNALPIVNQKLNLHYLQIIIITCETKINYGIEDFNNHAKYLDLNNPMIEHQYLYYQCLLLFKQKAYLEVINKLTNKLDNVHDLKLFLASLIRITDYKLQKEKIKALDMFKFTKYETIYQNYYYFIKIMLEDNNNYTLYSYLKNILLNKNNAFDYLIMADIKRFFIIVATACSKYKECTRLLLEDYNNSLHDLISK